MSGFGFHVAVPITEASQVGAARRVAATAAARLEMDAVVAGKLALIVTEAATNIVKHAGSGELLIRALEGRKPETRRRGVEVIALDRGPGMSDIARCFADGYSTAGSPGTGLGAIARLASEHDVYSVPGLGTALLARVWSGSETSADAVGAFEVAGICVPYPGETIPGDDWAAVATPDSAGLIVADGLGHGPVAAEASAEAVRVFEQNSTMAPDALLELAHGALRATRGAAVAIAQIDLRSLEIRYCGLGNITASLITLTESRSLVSMNGTVGAQARKFQAFSYPWAQGGVLIMYSDGLSTHWNLQKYPGLLARNPALIAAVLYRDFSRGRDDVTVVAARCVGASA